MMGRQKPIKRISGNGIVKEEAGEISGGDEVSMEEKSLSVLAFEGKPKLEPADLYRIEMYYAKMELSHVKAENCELKARLKELENALSIRSIRNDGQIHGNDSQKWKSLAKDFMLSLGSKYGVDFSRASYDDETGTIHILEPDGNNQPDQKSG